MAKKKGNPKIEEAREIYCTTDLSLQDIAEELGINVNTLYKYSTQEKWVLLKESKVRDAIQYRNQILLDRKLKDIKFYETIMNKCSELVEQVEVGKELKELTATFILAEDRYFLLSKERLESNKEIASTGESILDELANM